MTARNGDKHKIQVIAARIFQEIPQHTVVGIVAPVTLPSVQTEMMGKSVIFHRNVTPSDAF